MKQLSISISLAPLILAIITFLCYLPSVYYAFQFDDLANIVKFYDIRHKTIKDLFFSNTRWISYWLNTLYYKIGKFNPFYYRLGNICFHIITGILIFYMIYFTLSRLSKHPFFQRHAYPIAAGTAALFLLHPVQTQTVSYVIQGQLEGLAGLFMISIMLCFFAYTQVSKLWCKWLLFSLLCILSILSCGTKEIVIITPLLLLIFDWFLVAQGDLRALRRRWWIHAAVWLIIGSIYVYFLKPVYFARVFGFAIETQNNIGNVLTKDPHAKITSSWYFISQFKVILHYLFIFIWPFSISADYDWMLVDDFFAPDCFFPLVILIILGWFVYSRLKKNNTDLIAFGLIWFLVTILPRSSIIPSTELVADYKTYTASIGLLFLIASALIVGFEYTLKKFKKTKNSLWWYKLGIPLSMLFCIGFATIERNKVWRSGEEFWWNVIQNAPNKARAYNNYGVSLSEKGQFTQAISYFKKAISMDHYYPDPCNNLAVVYSAVGNIDGAIQSMKQGITIQPYYPEGYNNLASFYLQKKEYAQAEVALKQAIKLRSYYGKAYFNLGRLYLELNKKEEAYEAFKQCCTKADFDNDVGFASYGMVCLMLNKPAEAIVAYNRVLDLKPQDSSARFNLGNAFFMNKDYDAARSLFEQLLHEHPQDTKVAFNLGETHYAQHQFASALSYFTQAINNQELPQAALRIAACQAKLGNYRASQQNLVSILQNSSMPQDIKETAQLALKEISKKVTRS